MTRFSSAPIDWSPFSICKEGEKSPYLRSIQTFEGLGDRLRFVAFAEKQAANAFRLASEIYPDANDEVRSLWIRLAEEEEKHLQLLLDRMKEIGVSPSDRPQSLDLWKSFDRCNTATEFAKFMASAEDWGMNSGEKFHRTLLGIDPVTAQLFGRIAAEEKLHIELARKALDSSITNK